MSERGARVAPDADAYVIGAARARFDAAGLWAAEARGPAGWEDALAGSTRLARELAGVAGDALRAAGAGSLTAVGCAVGTAYGFAHVAEAIHRRLTHKGPAWIDPEAFLHYPAHVVAALICVRSALAAESITFLGPAAGGQALSHAVRSLTLGRHELYLAGAYELATPAGAQRLAALGFTAECKLAHAAFVVLASPRLQAAAGLGTPLARASLGRRRDALDDAEREGWPRTLAPFVALGENSGGGVPS
jgi:hypothetical protein